MSYLVLARKWRPRGFDDIIGQEPIVRILTNSLAQGKLAHAYVFSGPRGVGKTSTARILAKALNCQKGPTPAPCGTCPSCTGITEGNDVDVLEIDGASNNSVDNIRDLRERVKYTPSSGKYKVYIIDEAHMLSTSAFNALLKTLEEPPPHVIFVLATTEARKVPLTVMSRCQHMPFRRVSTTTIRSRLKHIVAEEKIKISDTALALVSRAADGSIRDSLTILDQVTAFSEEVRDEDVMNMLDVADFQALAKVAGAIIESKKDVVLSTIATLVDRGADLRTFTKDLIKFFRDLLVIKVLAPKDDLGGILDLSEEEAASMKDLAPGVSEEHITLLISELVKAEADVKFSFSPRVSVEMALIKASMLSNFRHINEALAVLSGGAPAQTQAEPAPARKLSAPTTPPAPKKAPARALPIPETVALETKAEDTPEDSTDSPPEEPVFSPVVDRTFTGESLLKAIVERTEDPRLSSKLAPATATLEGDTLTLTYNATDAELCSKPVKDRIKDIEKVATSLRDLPTKIEIHISKTAQTPRQNMKEKAKSDPVVKEVMDLFEGRIVNVKNLSEET